MADKVVYCFYLLRSRFNPRLSQLGFVAEKLVLVQALQGIAFH